MMGLKTYTTDVDAAGVRENGWVSDGDCLKGNTEKCQRLVNYSEIELLPR